MGRIVRTTIYPGQKLTKRQIRRLDALKDRPIVFDEDAPEYTYEELEEMRLAAIKKRAEQRKEVVAIRISPSTLKKAKAMGKGYTGFLSRLIDNAINDKDLVARSL
ncbi:BrnA antitoxin family protein [Candidatus Saccharibacteria bacterium]|nr:BrnA antitoxin family protein [Candidatus Saccharibacteria bacterium]